MGVYYGLLSPQHLRFYNSKFTKPLEGPKDTGGPLVGNTYSRSKKRDHFIANKISGQSTFSHLQKNYQKNYQTLSSDTVSGNIFLKFCLKLNLFMNITEILPCDL